MSEPKENNNEGGLREKVSGFTQKVIGEIETIGGILTADPNTQAEGEFNVEVGDVREGLESDLAESEETDPNEGEDR